MSEVTLVLIKPDAIAKGVIGEIITRYEHSGLEVINLKWTNPDQQLLSAHYHAHLNKGFYPALENFMRSGPVLAMVLRAEDAVKKVRILNGNTDPKKAQLNTIRALYGTNIQQNAVHGSEDFSAAKREIALWF